MSWIPGTVVLVVGLFAGLFMALRMKRPVAAGQGSPKKGQSRHDPRTDDLALEVADLEARRDVLYARLKGEHEEELDAGEARSLELDAARVLRDLDQATAKLGKIRPQQRTKSDKKTAGPVPTPAAHNPVLWFATGVVCTGLVAALIFWAINDAKPDPMAASNAAMASSDGHPEGLEGVPSEVRAQASALQAELETNPDNLDARKQLAMLLARHQQFFQAFQHAEEILRRDPDDPDALYISSVVRMSMGRSEEAIELIDRVLVQYPQHVLGHLVRGTALLQLGRREESLVAWRAGLEATGGNNAEIERMITEEFGPDAMNGGPAGAGPVSAGTSSPPPVDDGSPKEYRVYVELTPGAEVASGASLFVSVHQAGGGPPAAVRAVQNPQFPLELTLTQNDSNTGIPLPARGMIVVRLDSDGHPGTESPDDMAARGEGASGELVKFVLW